MAQAPVALSDTPPAAAPNLAASLAAARPLTNGLALAVGGDSVSRLPDTVPPGVQPSVAEVADEYGRITQRFGGVTAVAPPSMTVLHTDSLVPPDPFDGIPPNEALKLLFGSLDDRQWALLTGDTGLGATDLSNDQQSLFAAFLPDSALHVSTARGGDSVILKGNDLQTARLRLSQRVQIDLPVAGKPNNFVMTSVPPHADKPQYMASVEPNAAGRDTLFGLRVRDTVPNTLKPSDLDDRATIWQTPVDPSNVKTVGELISRIAMATGTELYADRRYEKRGLTLLGHGPVPASDLLRALAFCVCGAYRQVGTAFVLSNDRVGLVVRRALLDRIPLEAAKIRAGAVADAEHRLFTVREVKTGLPSREDTKLTDAQQALSSSSERSLFPIDGVNLRLTWTQLTVPQQELARREVDQLQGQQLGAGLSPTLNGTFQVSSQPALELLSPAVPGPIDLEGMMAGSVFEPSNALRQAYWDRMQKALPPATGTQTPNETVPPLSALLGRYGRRAVLARPRTAGDVATLVGDMKRLGFNQLWLDVFYDGKSHLGDGEDILTAALSQTKGTGILVVPALSLLTWGTDAPAEAADRTILGETSAQVQTRENREGNIRNGRTPAEADAMPPITTLSVCPMAASVRETLEALAQKLAATPGIAALALRDTVTSGYDNDRGSSTGDELGYAVPTRLAFLRRWHVDPTDPLTTGTQFYGPDRPDTSVPEFEGTAPAGPDLTGDWNDFRRAADRDLMQRLLAAAWTPAGQQIPLLVKDRGTHWIQDWYGLWTDPRAPFPTMTQAAIFNPPGNDNFAPLAHSQSRVNLYALPTWFGGSQAGLIDALQKLKPGWDGVVLDVSDHPGGDALSGLIAPFTSKADGGTPGKAAP